MRQTRVGLKHPPGRRSEAFPFADCTLAQIDKAATNSLKGNGKNRMKPSYGDKQKFVGRRAAEGNVAHLS